ncbi:MAG: hypothetical protein HY897_19980 [Deltaproteobacteria bacterium]|nr:hypothetical protein [Deltaproteobacteria bacterium]
MRRVLALWVVLALTLTSAAAADAKGKKKEKDPDAPPSGVRWSVDPTEMDFGEIEGGEEKTLGLRVLNSGDKEGAIRCQSTGPGAKYVVVDKTGTLIIPAVGAIELRITLDGKQVKPAKTEKDRKDIQVKAAVVCAGKRSDVKGVVKMKTEEEVKKAEPPPLDKAGEIPGL